MERPLGSASSEFLELGDDLTKELVDFSIVGRNIEITEGFISNRSKFFSKRASSSSTSVLDHKSTFNNNDYNRSHHHDAENPIMLSSSQSDTKINKKESNISQTKC
jgi:hypothetical protein